MHTHTHTHKHTSYPGSCVYKSKPIHFPSRDTDQTTTAFVADLQARLPTMCGDQMRYLSRALTPFTNLQPPTAQNLSHTNLRRLSPPKQIHTTIKDVPAHLRFNPKPEPTQVVPTISLQQFKGTRVVPIFKSNVITLSTQQKTVPHQSKSHTHPIIPKFKPSSISASSQLLGKRQPGNSLPTQVTKRPCLEAIVAKAQVANVSTLQTQSTTNLGKPVSQLSIKKPTSQQSVKKLSITKRQTHPKQVAQSVPSSSALTAVVDTQRHQSSTIQSVPDISHFLPGQLDDDFADFLPGKVPTLNKGVPHNGTMFTGVSTDLVNKVITITVYVF